MHSAVCAVNVCIACLLFQVQTAGGKKKKGEGDPETGGGHACLPHYGNI